MAKKKLISRNRAPARRQVRCYFCGESIDVSTKTLSTTCPGCHKAIKVEDVVVKSYLPVNDVQTCGQVTVTKKGRIAARKVQSGDGVVCEGSIEGLVETPGPVQLGPKSSWKGPTLASRTLEVKDGAKLHGHVTVPCAVVEKPTAKAQQQSKLVRRVEQPDPTSKLFDEDEQEEARPEVAKSDRVTEPKPQRKPEVEQQPATAESQATDKALTATAEAAAPAAKSSPASPTRKTTTKKKSPAKKKRSGSNASAKKKATSAAKDADAGDDAPPESTPTAKQRSATSRKKTAKKSTAKKTTRSASASKKKTKTTRKKSTRKKSAGTSSGSTSSTKRTAADDDSDCTLD